MTTLSIEATIKAAATFNASNLSRYSDEQLVRSHARLSHALQFASRHWGIEVRRAHAVRVKLAKELEARFGKPEPMVFVVEA